MPQGAVLYTRVSTQEQVNEGVSLDMQEARLRAYCTMQGLEVVEVIREAGISGTIALDERPGGIALLKLVAQHHVRHVIALKLDRLFRDAANCLTQTAAWDKRGVSVHVIDMGGATINTASAMGRMFLTMAAGFAELERNLIRERTTAALQHKKAMRQAYSPTPLGYSRDGSHLIANAEEMAVVRFVRAKRQEGWKLQQICDDLNQRGVRTKRGRFFVPATIKYLVENDLYREIPSAAPTITYLRDGRRQQVRPIVPPRITYRGEGKIEQEGPITQEGS